MKENTKVEKVPISYWRAALAEVNLLHPRVPAESKPILIGVAEGVWRVTFAEPDVAAWTSAQFAASKSRTDEKSARTIPFVLIAARLSELASHGVKRKARDVHEGQTAICIPCLLDRSACLWPDPDRDPWIPRDILEPTQMPVALGHLDDYDNYVSNLPDKATTFSDTLRIAGELFEAVTDARLPLLPSESDASESVPEFSLDDYEVVSEWHGIPYDPPIISRHIIRLYDRIIANKSRLPLLENLQTCVDRDSVKPVGVPQAERWYASTVGHINRKHCLSPSQRESMLELVRLNEGQVLSVNGPPGTGKTTLLQSVVAQLWVNAALTNSKCPLIVVTSTNVKAVENVLDSFEKICSETGHRRWHPYTGGFGLFMASGSRESTHPTCTTDENHPFTEHESLEAVESAEKFFLDKASGFFGQKQTSVSDVVKALQNRLKCCHEMLKRIVEVRYEVYEVTGQDINAGASSTCKQLLDGYQAVIGTEQSNIREADQSIKECDAELKTIESDYETAREEINRAEMAWNDYLANSPLWLDFLSFISSIRRRRMARDRNFLMTNPLTADCQHRDDGIPEHFRFLRKSALDRKSSNQAVVAARRADIEKCKSTALQRLHIAKQGWSKIDAVFCRWKDALKDSNEKMLDVSLSELNDRLDTDIRALMFSAADWYWSGQWLLEMRDRLKQGKTDTKGRASMEAKYRRFAKLSPCLVSNFHMAPAFFTAWQGESIPFWNTIDLLIVDEAGQVSPDVGAAMFALAKRALVVGDIYQIEPVWNNGEGTDRCNAVKFGLISSKHDPRYDALAEDGYTPASGNLMRVANRSCVVQKYEDMRGLMLVEHRRCVPELIGYCNKLIYSGRLDPLRPSIESVKRILPAFGYVNVTSQDKKVGKSRCNHVEASSIVKWLKTNRAQIEEYYLDEDGNNKPLWKLVGIVTPFKPQAGTITQLLRKEMPELTRNNSKLTVGTVHALQGAEREIVIFSPTYGESFTGGAFYDRTPNMLNVAVSRAKDSFLVFGNMGIFDTKKRSRPSGLLANYLFHGEQSSALEYRLPVARIPM
jgi:hypothetical protein